MKEELNKRLLEAAKIGDVSSISTCISEGADLSYRDDDKKSAIGWAKSNGHEDVVSRFSTVSWTLTRNWWRQQKLGI